MVTCDFCPCWSIFVRRNMAAAVWLMFTVFQLNLCDRVLFHSCFNWSKFPKLYSCRTNNLLFPSTFHCSSAN